MCTCVECLCARMRSTPIIMCRFMSGQKRNRAQERKKAGWETSKSATADVSGEVDLKNHEVTGSQDQFN